MAASSCKDIDSTLRLNHVSIEPGVQSATALLTVRRRKDQLSNYFDGEAAR